MATSKRELSPKINSVGESEIILRISAGRGVQPRIKTGIFIIPARFKNGSIIKPRANQEEANKLLKIETELAELEFFLFDLCAKTPKESITKDFLTEQADRFRHPDKYKMDEPKLHEFFPTFDYFLEVRDLSEQRIKHYRVLYRALQRFEAYKQLTGYPDYKITLDGFNVSDVNEFEAFYRAEPELAARYPDIFSAYPSDTRKIRKKPKPQPKGDNTVVCLFSLLRAFFNWCNAQEVTNNKPMAKYSGVKQERYGTPYFITIEERNTIANYDLSADPALSVQRDIFVFHCFIGCRISDLLRLTESNVINDAIEYIARKTEKERPKVTRVPLHPTARELVNKYAGQPDKRLFPFISAQRYNDAIKTIFTKCGITRAVTVRNSLTGQDEQRPLNEIASSHIARRTFAGNLYKKVKDPNLVGKLTGHAEGSKAFARYRDIDEDIMKETINLLED